MQINILFVFEKLLAFPTSIYLPLRVSIKRRKNSIKACNPEVRSRSSVTEVPSGPQFQSKFTDAAKDQRRTQSFIVFGKHTDVLRPTKLLIFFHCRCINRGHVASPTKTRNDPTITPIRKCEGTAVMNPF